MFYDQQYSTSYPDGKKYPSLLYSGKSTQKRKVNVEQEKSVSSLAGMIIV